MVTARRRFLELLGAASGAGLAGCTTFDAGEDASPTGTATETGTPTGTPTATETPTDTETETSTATGPHAWPMFQNDRRNTGHADTTGPTESVTELWRAQPNTTISAPAVADDTVYVSSGATLYALTGN